MKYLFYNIILIFIVFSFFSCAKKKNENEQKRQVTQKKTWNFKKEEEIREYLNIYTKEFENDPQLIKITKDILAQYMPDENPDNSEDQLYLLYDILSDSNSYLSAGQGALSIFCELKANEIIKEALLHQNKDIVITASNYLIQQSQKNEKDITSLPYLIYVLNKNNYPAEGSESATIHSIMKKTLIEAIKAITGLEINVDKINVNDPEKIENVLSQARDWAKKHNLKLLDKQ